jgi:hypothetical protein
MSGIHSVRASRPVKCAVHRPNPMIPRPSTASIGQRVGPPLPQWPRPRRNRRDANRRALQVSARWEPRSGATNPTDPEDRHRIYAHPRSFRRAGVLLWTDTPFDEAAATAMQAKRGRGSATNVDAASNTRAEPCRRSHRAALAVFAGTNRPGAAWIGVEVLLRALRNEERIAFALPSIVQGGHLPIERALTVLAEVYGAQSRNELIVGLVGQELDRARISTC